MSALPEETVTIVTESVPLWQLAAEAGPFVRIAGLMGALATILGAYGAHRSYPKDKAEKLQAVFKVGSLYHFFHTLVMFATPLASYPMMSASLFILGTALFSGGCYYNAFTGSDKFVRIIPMGGTLLILAWLSLIL